MNMEVSKELKEVVYNKLQREYDEFCKKLSTYSPEINISKSQKISGMKRILNLFTPTKDNFSYNQLQSALQYNSVIESLYRESSVDVSYTELLVNAKNNLAKDYVNLEKLTEPIRVFVDMDGTLAEFKSVSKIEELFEEGYFLNLKPLDNMVTAIRELNQNPNYNIYILSSVLEQSKYAHHEKMEWLGSYIPEITPNQVIFSVCGQNKTDFVPNGIKSTDILLDDYNLNLNEWMQEGGKPIKVLNGINNTHRNWKLATVHFKSDPSDITHSIKKISTEGIQQHISQILPNQITNNRPVFLDLNL